MSESKREPIAVAIIKFNGPQDGPGLSVASSCTARDPETEGGRRSRHSVEFYPWLRAFLVTYHPPEGEPIAAFIPEARVMCWYPRKAAAPAEGPPKRR